MTIWSGDFEPPIEGEVVEFRRPIGGFMRGTMRYYDHERMTYAFLVQQDPPLKVVLGAEQMAIMCKLPQRRSWQHDFIEMLADAERAKNRPAGSVAGPKVES